MTEIEIREFIKKGEGLTIEFKAASLDIPKSTYETVCAFLNTKGGHILLGVTDNGEIKGIDPKKVDKMEQDFINTVSNLDKIDPSFIPSVTKVEINNKIILDIFIPEGSQVHKCKQKIYIRQNEGDFDITKCQDRVAKLYAKKCKLDFENEVYPKVQPKDLSKKLIKKSKQLALIHNEDHPWNNMNDLDLLKSAKLYQQDPETGKYGVTLAGILLLGSEDLVSQIIPRFKVDLINRVENVDRYDDRVVLRTNLIECYDQVTDFVEKHLPTPFFLEGNIRINLRNKIFRELVANMLMHKEYLGAEPTRLIIERDKIYTENSNRPHAHGIVKIKELKPESKNPNIARFFRYIGMAEEMGSGFAKIQKYCKAFSGYDPIINDDEMFTFTMKHNFFAAKGYFEDKNTQKNADKMQTKCRQNLIRKRDNY